MIEATIILLVKNGARYLDEILQAIFGQQVSFEFEVIAVDSGSRDATLEILSRFPVKVVTIPHETFNHGETRNLGAEYACETSRFLVYLTQDATPANSYWLANLIAPMKEDERVAGVYSRHLPRPESSPSYVRQLTTVWQSGGVQRLVKEMPHSLEEYEKRKDYYTYFSDTSSALHRSIWRENRFPQTMFAEDAIWADTVLRKGYRIIFEPASMVIHSHDFTVIDQFKQNVDHAHGMVNLFNPPHYQELSFWIRLFRGIPRHVWRDWFFIKHSAYFANTPFFSKIRFAVFSPFWHFASCFGTLLGAKLDLFPAFLRHKFSRQDRIRSK